MKDARIRIAYYTLPSVGVWIILLMISFIHDLPHWLYWLFLVLAVSSTAFGVLFGAARKGSDDQQANTTKGRR